MTKVTKSVEIDAPPEEVFTFINDMEKMNAACKGSTEGKYTSRGPVGVGTTMHFVGKAGSIQAEFDMEITEFVRNTKVAARAIGESKFKVNISRTLEPTAKGTKLTNTADYELSYSILGKIVDS